MILDFNIIIKYFVKMLPLFKTQLHLTFKI